MTGWLPEDDDPAHEPQRADNALLLSMPKMTETEAQQALALIPEDEVVDLDRLHAVGLHGWPGMRRKSKTDGPEISEFRPIWTVLYRNAERD